MLHFRIFDAQGETLGETSGATRTEAVELAAQLEWGDQMWWVSTTPHGGVGLN